MCHLPGGTGPDAGHKKGPADFPCPGGFAGHRPAVRGSFGLYSLPPGRAGLQQCSHHIGKGCGAFLGSAEAGLGKFFYRVVQDLPAEFAGGQRKPEVCGKVRRLFSVHDLYYCGGYSADGAVLDGRRQKGPGLVCWHRAPLRGLHFGAVVCFCDELFLHHQLSVDVHHQSAACIGLCAGHPGCD